LGIFYRRVSGSFNKSTIKISSAGLFSI
jgi:hypothetical protein